MTLRERFIKTLRFQEVDRVPNMEMGYWKETIERWYKEGLPQHIEPSELGNQEPTQLLSGRNTERI